MTVSTAAGVATSYRYDGANRLSSVAQGATTLGEYIYNNDGLRVRKTEAGKTTYYVYDGSQCVYTEEYVGAATTASKQLVNTYLSGMNLASYDALTSTYTYNLLDHLGSRRKVISKLGAVVESIDLDIFGNQVTGTYQNYRFTDKEKDSATGLVYFNARYYNPNLGRFITEDPIRDGINWYAYCANNPLKFTDPSGLWTDAGEGGGVIPDNEEEFAAACGFHWDPELSRDEQMNERYGPGAAAYQYRGMGYKKASAYVSSIPRSSLVSDCTQFLARALSDWFGITIPVVCSRDIAASGIYREVRSPMSGGIVVWRATKGNESEGHAGILTGMYGDKEVINNQDPKGVSFTSIQKVSNHYANEGFTFSVRYYIYVGPRAP